MVGMVVWSVLLSLMVSARGVMKGNFVLVKLIRFLEP